MSKQIDYANWDKLAAEEEQREREQKQKEREERQFQHFREQAIKKREYDQKQAQLKPHDHDHEPIPGMSGNRPRCGCGYINPDELKQLRYCIEMNSNTCRSRDFTLSHHICISEAPPTPEIPLEEKNEKKKKAVAATREHGAQLFAAGEFTQVLVAYDGCL